MSGGGGGQPQMMFLPQTQQQSQTSSTQLPAWVSAAGQSNYDAAANMNPAAFAAFNGPRVADMTQGQTDAINKITNNVGSTQPYFANALNTSQGVQNYNPLMVNAQSLPGSDLSAYMNPYTDSVVNSSLNVLDQQRAADINRNHDAANAAKAFGGSRQQLQDAVTNSQYGLQGSQLAANLYNQNYTNALSALQSDQARNLQAQQSNQAAGLQGAATNLNAANLTGSLAGAGQDAYLNGLNASFAGNALMQNQNQNQINANMQQYADQQQSMLAPLYLKMQALGMTPYNTTTTSSGSSSGISAQPYQNTSASPMMQLAGGLLGGASTAAKLGWKPFG